MVCRAALTEKTFGREQLVAANTQEELKVMTGVANVAMERYRLLHQIFEKNYTT